MGLMGLGGAVAIVGGVLFIVVVIAALRAAPAPEAHQPLHIS
jgi:hypothetical protein